MQRGLSAIAELLVYNISQLCQHEPATTVSNVSNFMQLSAYFSAMGTPGRHLACLLLMTL